MTTPKQVRTTASSRIVVSKFLRTSTLRPPSFPAGPCTARVKTLAALLVIFEHVETRAARATAGPNRPPASAPGASRTASSRDAGPHGVGSAPRAPPHALGSLADQDQVGHLAPAPARPAARSRRPCPCRRRSGSPAPASPARLLTTLPTLVPFESSYQVTPSSIRTGIHAMVEAAKGAGRLPGDARRGSLPGAAGSGPP